MNVDIKTLFLIEQKEGLSLEFSKLVSMMNYTRVTTLEEVKGLSVDELDFLYDENANSIGMLLEHMAAVEKGYQIESFQGRNVTDEEISNLNPGLDLGNAAREKIRGKSIDFYVSQLAEVRNTTIETFKTLPDEWLYKQSTF